MIPEALKGIDIVFQYGAIGVVLIFTLVVNVILVFKVMPDDRKKSEDRADAARTAFLEAIEDSRTDFLKALEKHRGPLQEALHAMACELHALKDLLRECQKH